MNFDFDAVYSDEVSTTEAALATRPGMSHNGINFGLESI